MVDNQPNPLNIATREDINRLSDKIDGLPNIFVLRSEHNSTTATTTALISAVSAQVTQLSSQVEKNRETVDRTNADGGRWLLTKFDEVEGRLNKKLDEQNERIDKHSEWRLGLLYSTVSSGIVAIVVIVATHFWH